MKIYMFVSVDFVSDPAVAGNTYWYLCDYSTAYIGGKVIAPLGSHNRLQHGVVRRIMFAQKEYAPYPLDRIKRIEALEEQ